MVAKWIRSTGVQRMVRASAWSHAVTRTAIGTGLLLSRRRIARSWLGDDVDSGGGDVATNALAIRDLVLGAGMLNALGSQAPVKRWFQLGVAIETVELSAMARRRAELGSKVDFWLIITAIGLIGGTLIAATIQDHDEPVQ